MEESDCSWDTDIAALALSDAEKNGLQVFRNYKVAFEKRREDDFINEIDGEAVDFGALKKIADLIANDDFRMVAVAACAYADELLKLTFGAVVPADVPGGRSNFLGSMGPVSSFAKRLQLAHAFDLLSSDLVLDWDRVRSARNRISHTWETESHAALIADGAVSNVYPVETLFTSKVDPSALTDLDAIARFRLRLMWLCGRLTYKATLYQRARAARVDPDTVLYGPKQTRRLAEVVGVLMPPSHAVIQRA